jgi:hypothetical protein
MWADNIQNSNYYEISDSVFVLEKARRFRSQNKKKSGFSPIASDSQETISGKK